MHVPLIPPTSFKTNGTEAFDHWETYTAINETYDKEPILLAFISKMNEQAWRNRVRNEITTRPYGWFIDHAFIVVDSYKTNRDILAESARKG